MSSVISCWLRTIVKLMSSGVAARKRSSPSCVTRSVQPPTLSSVAVPASGSTEQVAGVRLVSVVGRPEVDDAGTGIGSVR